MNKTNRLVLIVTVIIVLIGAAIILFKPEKSSAPSTTGSTANTDSDSEGSAKPVSATITYDGTAFTSSVSSVNSGASVKVVNSSDEDLDFDSDPHPVHTDNPELNAGDIPAGESKTFTLTEKGTWGYHNHLNSSQHGEIMVN